MRTEAEWVGAEEAGRKNRRALLLVNRHARHGGEAIDEAIAILRDGGIEVEPHAFPKKHPMPGIILGKAPAYDCVIVGGGDGTLNAIAPALVETGLPLGILPLGTANDLARTLGIPPDPVAAARIIVEGHVRELDLGDVNGHLFWNVASIGLSVDLTKALTKKLKKRWGKLAYGIATLGMLRRMRPFTVEFVHDGRTERSRTVQVSVGNGRHHGGSLTVEHSAELDDGLLHVYSLEIRHWWQLLALYPALRSGRQGLWKDVRSFSCTELEIRTRRPKSVNTDGALTVKTPARFRVHPRAVRVFAPA